MTPERNWMVGAGYTVGGGAEGMRRILAQCQPLPTAVFAATLLSAVGAMRVLQEVAIAIPRQFSVVAVHDGSIAKFRFPL